MNIASLIPEDIGRELILFAYDLVRIRSYSGREEEIIRFIEQKMISLGYDRVIVDAMGNLTGIIGDGPVSVMFDSHVDTVEVNDEDEWDIQPFSGEIVDGRLHGRGSVDMKSSVAASVYAGAIAKKSGLTAGRTIYVTCTVSEEDCDGENLKHLLKELGLKPGFVVICEPSGNRIALGHKGKAQVKITTHGIPAHGSAPEKGQNAIYEMAEIIHRTENLNARLAGNGSPHGTIVLSQISSTSESLNAVPSECEIYLDRRMIEGENEETIRSEMDKLVEGKRATWEVGTLYRKSWTGLDIVYKPMHTAWKIEPDHDLTRKCILAYNEYYGTDPGSFEYWDFSTNAVTPVRMGIPTIGFGPGDYKLAHMRNESCEVNQIIDACGFYIKLIAKV